LINKVWGGADRVGADKYEWGGGAKNRVCVEDLISREGGEADK